MNTRPLLLLLPAALLVLSACGSFGHRSPPGIDRLPGEQASAKPKPSPAGAKRGGYYSDDGPGDATPENLDAIPDAVPRLEPLASGPNKPYTVLGQSFTPMTRFAPYRERGIGSWYGRKFHGQKTSSGEPYDMYGMTAAHPTLPIPSYARVTNPENGRAVVVRVNDRGPFLHGRIIDLSYTAAHRLGYAQKGSAGVEVELILLDGSETLYAGMTQGRRPPSALASAPVAAPPPVPTGDPLADWLKTAVENESPPTRSPVVAASPSPPPTGAAGGNFWLQLGAFASRDNAESFSARMGDQLAFLGSRVEVYARNSLFRVHVGPYANRADALKAAEKLAEAMAVKPSLMVR